jgi:hypothetical protein
VDCHLLPVFQSTEPRYAIGFWLPFCSFRFKDSGLLALLLSFFRLFF